jgi:hypothetical protein
VRQAVQTRGVDIKGKPGAFSKQKLLKFGAAYGGIKLLEKVTGINVPVF